MTYSRQQTGAGQAGGECPRHASLVTDSGGDGQQTALAGSRRDGRLVAFREGQRRRQKGIVDVIRGGGSAAKAGGRQDGIGWESLAVRAGGCV